MTGWVKTHEKKRFSCCSHSRVLWWAPCLLLREKEAMYLFIHTHTKIGVGQKTWQEWREGGKAALVLGTYIADSDFCLIIRSRTLGFATAALPPSSRVTRGK